MLGRHIAVIPPLRPHPMPRVSTIATMLAVGLAAAGCGSSKTTSSSTTATAAAGPKPALSKTQFLAQGNAICKQGNQVLGGAEGTLGPHPSHAQIKTFTTTVFIPAIQSQIEAIRALRAPAADQGAVTNMLDVAQADLNRVKSNPNSLMEKSFANFAKLAHAYGLTTCASNS